MIHSLPIEHFLAELYNQNIRVWVEDGRLRCSGPDLALTPGVTDTIRTRKADILAFLSGAGETELLPPVTVQNDTNPPLSFAQQRLWFIDQLLPDSAVHNIPFAIEAFGQLDEAALERALVQVVGRHGVLRARISSQDGQAQQTIWAEAALPVKRIDRRQTPPSDAEVSWLTNIEARRPFDLSKEPPLRLVMIRVSEERTLLLFTLHHIAADGTSIDILTRDLSSFYQSQISGELAALPPLPVQYGDFAIWERDYLQGPVAQKKLAFWQRSLSQPLPVTQIATDFARPPVQTHAGALYSFCIPAKISAAIRRIGMEQNSTLFATLFTAFNVLLYRYTGQSDLIVGTPVANRKQGETESLIGLFVNPLAIRSQIDPFSSFAENLQWIKKTLAEALRHQDLPFERLVEALQIERDPSVSPLFQIKFQLDAESTEQTALPGVELKRLPRQDGIAKLDLSLDLREMPGFIAGSFEYNTDLFRAETITALADHFVNLLQAITEAPALAVTELSLLSAEDRHKQLVDWNNTTREYEAGACFPQLFEKHATQTPEAIALTYVLNGTSASVSYTELNRQSNRIAHHLRTLGIGPETVVAIALERGPEMIAAWLGVLKAGAAYLPLDPDYPADRIEYMLGDSGAVLLITNSRMIFSGQTKRLDLDLGWPEGLDTNPLPINGTDHLAYTIYTSGSTGRPKGVLVTHEGLVNLTTDKIRVCDVRPGDCVLQFFSFSFDASIPELVMSLGAGARLLMASSADVLPGPGLAQLLVDQGVTHITMTPSALQCLPSGAYSDLRMVLVGGEAPSAELIERWSKGRVFINAYGPTETTVNASMVACGNGAPLEATVQSAANKKLYVLDEHLQLLPPGVPGELYIGGIGLARGYHLRPDLTAASFLPDPFAPKGKAAVIYRSGDRACQLPDGRIRILGRVDHQVKIRGYRIEPGEVEAALLGHGDVDSVVVAVREDTPGIKRLVAYAVPVTTGHASVREIRAYLAQKLPRFLVPEAFLWLDAIPLTINGKVDLQALPAPEVSDSEGRLPQGSTEIALAELFGRLLGVSDVRAESDFFELGGHSLLATQLVAAALESFGIELSVLDLFNGPTVEALALRIDDRLVGADRRKLSDAPHRRENWQRDAKLENDIRPAGLVTVLATYPKRVLLTGGTGFVGAYLLTELLRQPDREVFCLVRGEPGIDRLKAALESYGLWKPSFAARLHGINGNLTEPQLGISDVDYALLAETVDAIFHNAAEVHHVMPYEWLRAANVEGTREILRLACAGAGRPLHYISSLSVLPAAPLPDRPRFYETDMLSDYPPPVGGYNRSKWVAEQLVAEAAQRGLPVTVYRPGPVSGDSETGAFNSADFLCRVLQGYLHSGTAPEGTLSLDFMPVDYLAKAIVHLSNQPASVGRIYHLIHSRPVSSDILFDACEMEGMPIHRVPYQVWHRDLMDIARDDPDHPLYPLVALFAARGEEIRETHVLPFDCSVSRAALADTPFEEPPLDLALFRNYLRAFVRAGAVPASKTGALLQ